MDAAHTKLEQEAWSTSLRLAREGHREPLGLIFEDARDYLLQIARRLLATDAQSKLGGSDVVQDSFCEAQRDFGQFRGETRAELLGWLRGILVHNLFNHLRRLRGTQMRDIGREVSLEDCAGIPAELVDDATTPSQVLMRQEAVARLHQALEQLPADYRQVLLLRHQDHLPFAEIGERMQRSADAARMLWSRAFERLASGLDAGSSESTSP